MSAIAVCLDLKIYSLIFFLLLFAHRYEGEFVPHLDYLSMNVLVTTGTDIVKSTYELIDSIEYIKQNHMNTPSFEVGYLMFNTFEKYRRMIDKYNSSHMIAEQVFTVQLILYLEEIENHYWELDHLSSMLHEIERKYNVTSGLYTKYHEITSAELRAIDAEQKAPELLHRGEFQTLKKFRMRKKVFDRLQPTKKKVTGARFPLQYGWDYPDPWG